MKKTITIISLILVISIAAVLLTSCVPSTLANAQTKLQEAGYSVVYYDGNTVEGVEGYIIGIKSLNSGYLMATLYDSIDSAKKAHAKHTSENQEGEREVKRSGRWVYIGDKEGLKDFR